MRYLTKPRPVLGSFIAAAVSLLPILAMALHELHPYLAGNADVDELDDGAYRGAGLFLAAMPFVYLVAVPVCYAVGTLLLSLGLQRLRWFLVGANAVALIVGMTGGLLLSRFGVNDLLISIQVCVVFLLVTGLPAAACWWCFVVLPRRANS